MIELLFKKKLLIICTSIILLIFAFGFLGTMYIFTTPEKVYRTPAWAPEYDYYCSFPGNRTNDFSNCYQKINKYQPPSLSHPLGLDENGRDELSRLAWGTRHSLEIGLVASITITFLAILFGAIGSYSGGSIDDISQFIVNLFIVIPVIPILIYISYLTQASGIVFKIPLFTTPRPSPTMPPPPAPTISAR